MSDFYSNIVSRSSVAPGQIIDSPIKLALLLLTPGILVFNVQNTWPQFVRFHFVKNIDLRSLL